MCLLVLSVVFVSVAIKDIGYRFCKDLKCHWQMWSFYENRRLILSFRLKSCKHFTTCTDVRSHESGQTGHMTDSRKIFWLNDG